MTSKLTQQHIWHGGDYNPDQWPKHIWDEDTQLMQEAEWNIATLPVFGWQALQSDETTFHFEWLDTVLDKLAAAKIGVCLATATASVPSWVTEKYPDVLTTGPHGKVVLHGGRHIFCPNSPNFHRLATVLVRKIAERYASHPALRLWHVSNEYGGNDNGGRCFCPRCAEAFRGWLINRYERLEVLNHRWDTAFWGKTFTSWSQIEPPLEHGERSIQALLLDYDRFQSQSLLNCYRAEAAILREVTPQIPITTNMMGTFKPLNYHEWASEIDVVSWDCYPHPSMTFSQVAFSHALMRGLKGGQPWLLMEQTPSQTNWQPQCSLKRPGVMRLQSYQAVAHGADSVMYFQWRRTRGGNEKFHGAIVEHAGTSNTRVFREVAALGRELRESGDQIAGSRVQARVALLFDWENWWAIEYAKGPNYDLKYVPGCMAFYSALHEQGIVCDIISPDADFSKYSLIVAPTLYMVKEGCAPKLEAYVGAGGTFLTTFLSGVADECDSVHLGGYPGPLRKLMGLWVEEVDALQPGHNNSVVFETPFGEVAAEVPCQLICERVHLEGAKELAVFGNDFYEGEPAVTCHQFGRGQTYYLASALDQSGLKPLLREICSRAGVAPIIEALPEGVEVMPRVSAEDETMLYVLNHNTAPVVVSLDEGVFSDLLSGHQINGCLELPPYGVAILRASQHQ